MKLSWIFDTAPSALAVALAISGGVLLLVSLAVGLARRKLWRAADTEGDVDNFLLHVVRGTSITLLILPAVYAGSRAVALPEETSSLLRTLTRVSLIAQVALWSAALVDFSSRRYHRRRVESDPAAVVGIALATQNILGDLFASLSIVLDKPWFGDSSYDFEFVYYVLSADYNVSMDVQQAINLAIVAAFEKEGIELAYPTRTLYLQRPAQAAAAAA